MQYGWLGRTGRLPVPVPAPGRLSNTLVVGSQLDQAEEISVHGQEGAFLVRGEVGEALRVLSQLGMQAQEVGAVVGREGGRVLSHSDGSEARVSAWA